MTENEAIEYIHSVCWMGSRPGLERIGELCRLMGDPQDSLCFIHVAGTNGKGSFCSMLSSVLSAAGYKVGLFTSPYIEEFGERIKVCGENISGQELGDVTEHVKSFADTMADPPTEFELITAMGFEHFKRRGCDVVILEAGLGGRLDSTNIIKKSLLSVITGIALDHTELLGDTHEKIAAEKAGIIKENGRVLAGQITPGAAEVIRAAAEAKNATLTLCDYGRIAAESVTLEGTRIEFSPRNVENSAGGEYSLALLGKYQANNAALVLSAVEVLRDIGLPVPQSAVHRGLAEARWPARFEVLLRRPVVIYDGAHNPQGVDAAKANFGLFHGVKPVLLTGVMADKAHGEMTAALSPLICSVHTVKPENPRAMEAEALAAEFESRGVHATAHLSLSDGVREAFLDAEERGVPLMILGSLYMYADVKRALFDFLGLRGEKA